MPSLLQSFFKRAETSSGFVKERHGSHSSYSSTNPFIDSGTDSDCSSNSSSRKLAVVTAAPVKKEKCKATRKPSAKRYTPPAQLVEFHNNPVKAVPVETLRSKSACVDMSVTFNEKYEDWYTSPLYMQSLEEESTKSSTVDLKEMFFVQADSWYTAPRPQLRLQIHQKPSASEYLLNE